MSNSPLAPTVTGLAFLAFATLAANPALASPAVTVDQAGFLSGPGVAYASAGMVPAGTHVDVIWCGTTEGWCLVELHRKKGWLPLASLNLKPGKRGSTSGDEAGAHEANGQAGSGTTAGSSGSSHLQLTETKPQITLSEPNHPSCNDCDSIMTTKKYQ